MFSVFDDDMFSMYLQQLAFKIEQAKKKHKYFFSPAQLRHNWRLLYIDALW